MKTNEWKQRAVTAGAILIYVCVSCLSAWGQAPSSRQIPFSGVQTTIAPSTPAQTLTLQVLNDAVPPTALYCETQTLDVDANGAVILDATGVSVLPPPGPLPLRAVAFALSPGPQGPAGPTGVVRFES
jgi:hypothetical protein